MKKILSLILVILLIATFFTACSKSNPEKISLSKSETNNKNSSTISATFNTEPWNNCMVFVNEMAYGQLNGNNNFSCYNKSGEVLFDLESELTPICLAIDGYSLVKKVSSESSYFIVDKSGNTKVVADFGEGATIAEQIGNLNMNGKIFNFHAAAMDGYFILAREITSFDGSVCEAAVVKEGKITIEFNKELYDFIDNLDCTYYNSYLYIKEETYEYYNEDPKVNYKTLNLLTGEYGTDISKVNLIDNTAPKLDTETFDYSSEYKNDKAVVTFRSGTNADECYFGIVDRNKKLLFEPIKNELNGEVEICENNILLSSVLSNYDGVEISLATFDISGKEIGNKKINCESTVAPRVYFSDNVITVIYYNADSKVEHYNVNFDLLF